jgi:hypothetical protein
MKEPGHGKQFDFFGEFGSKKKAVRKERKHPGSFIIKRKGYFFVVKERGKK